MNQAAGGWTSSGTGANGAAPPAERPRTVPSHAVVALRTTALLILAALAILVLLPAALAQAVIAG